jgi:DNA-directed RNA polymerase sigma subunit (sigma70/sigma32)
MRHYRLDRHDWENRSVIGGRLGTKRERINQIQIEALRLLRRMVESGRF